MKVAAIDIGSNSVHMVVAEREGARSFRVVDRAKDMVKLGAGTFRSGWLSADTIARGVDTIDEYCTLADRLGADEILAVATSAVREARNGGAFLDAVHRRTGVRPRMISGREEGRLIFDACRHAIELGDARAVVIDVGGGSVELTRGTAAGVDEAVSLRLGVQRLLDEIGEAGPLGKSARREVRERVRTVAGAACERARAAEVSLALGTSGTIRALGRAARALAGSPVGDHLNAEAVTREQLAALVHRLVRSEPRERREHDGIDERRADAIALGGLVVVELLELLGVDTLTLSDASLRDGMIVDFFASHQRERRPRVGVGPSVRERAVTQLLRRHREGDDARARHVAVIALQIFDDLRATHGLGGPERELLVHAAMLHEIGLHISFRRYHKHGRYILRHTRLRGFSGAEIELLGHIIRYHRRGLPTKRHKKYKRLSKSSRRVVSLLAGILRIARGLDRGAAQVVQSVHAHQQGERVIIEADGIGDVSLELGSARRNARLLARALDCPVEIRGGSAR